MNKSSRFKLIRIVMINLLLFSIIGFVSASNVEFYYHPNCSHCKDVFNYLKILTLFHPNSQFVSVDISTGSYSILNVPLIIIDGNVALLGSDKIIKWLPLILKNNEPSESRQPTEQDIFIGCWEIEGNKYSRFIDSQGNSFLGKYLD